MIKHVRPVLPEEGDGRWSLVVAIVREKWNCGDVVPGLMCSGEGGLGYGGERRLEGLMEPVLSGP